jgi:hypothetical protein
MQPKKKKNGIKKRFTVKAPKNLCIYTKDNHLSTQTFINEFENHIFEHHKYVTLDFSETERITAAAALYLAASINYCQNCSPHQITFKDQVIAYKLPSKSIRQSLFVDTGIWDIIRPGGITKLERIMKDMTSPFKTGNRPDEQFGDVLTWLSERNIPPRKKLFSAVQEAYLNVKQHAYPEEGTHEFLSNRWWQYAIIKENQFVFLLYDRGVGIPYNVGKTDPKIIIDDQRIKAAMTEGWTSTGEPGRGRGSKDIQNPVSISANNDKLLILSGSGRYVYRNEETNIHSLAKRFNGTLIEWAFPLSN